MRDISRHAMMCTGCSSYCRQAKAERLQLRVCALVMYEIAKPALFVVVPSVEVSDPTH